jgi:UDP-2,3-diacylglucosamine hydrolase
MALYFISDLHLQEERPDVCRAFFHYLQNLPGDAQALYILGDMFEVWIGDDDDSPFNLSVLKQLKEASARIPIHVMPGNRDFLFGKNFCLASGCLLIDDPTVIDYHNQPYLLMHGDSLCTQDQAYMAFRSQVRSQQWQAEILALPLAQRRTLAEQLRQTSMQANDGKSEEIMDVTPAEVIKVMSDHKVLTLIHGHTHRPAKHQLLLDGQPAQRWVLGDWDSFGWQIRLDSSGPELSKFPISK